jgi:hypothetical protein
VGWGHERLRSQNMRPTLQHYFYIQCTTLLETSGMQCVWNKNRRSTHAHWDHTRNPPPPQSPARSSQRTSIGARTVGLDIATFNAELSLVRGSQVAWKQVSWKQKLERTWLMWTVFQARFKSTERTVSSFK